MPNKLGSSVDVISSARAQRKQRITATWTMGRDVESALCLTVVEFIMSDDGRSGSDDE